MCFPLCGVTSLSSGTPLLHLRPCRSWWSSTSRAPSRTASRPLTPPCSFPSRILSDGAPPGLLVWPPYVLSPHVLGEPCPCPSPGTGQKPLSPPDATSIPCKIILRSNLSACVGGKITFLATKNLKLLPPNRREMQCWHFFQGNTPMSRLLLDQGGDGARGFLRPSGHKEKVPYLLAYAAPQNIVSTFILKAEGLGAGKIKIL